MALDLTPLESLSPAVERAVGDKTPAPLKMMAARGLAPMPPQDLLVALYQLSFSADDALKTAAFQTAAGLPEKILSGALREESLDVRVLDFFARRVFQKPPLLEVILLNKGTSDETFVHLASLCEGASLDMIAKNEQRLLRTPNIIAALYMNKKTPMSIAQRAIELAVRNKVKVEGIPAFEEAAKAIAESGESAATITPELDAQFAAVAEAVIEPDSGGLIFEEDPEAKKERERAEAELAELLAEGKGDGATQEEADKKRQKITDLPVPMQIRMATLGNAFARSVLIRSKIKQVALACIRSPAVSENEAISFAANRALDAEIITYIANNRQWTRLYGLKVALCNNPKCPMAITVRLLPHLQAKDVRALARSKGIPSALATAAKQLLQSRNQ